MEERTILVLDDDQAVRGTIADILADEGYRVNCAAKDPALLPSIRVAPPDALLLDLLMGQSCSGWLILHQLRSDPRTAALPVIATTADLRVHALCEGELAVYGVPLLQKPFAIEALLALVAEAVRDAPAMLHASP
jgi:CheY-like chemotaxis protein